MVTQFKPTILCRCIKCSPSFFSPGNSCVRDFFAIECVDVAYINTYSCEGVAAKEGLFIGAATHMQSFSLEQEPSMYVLAVLASFCMTKVYAIEAEG
jgi:hypothetical protein